MSRKIGALLLALALLMPTAEAFYAATSMPSKALIVGEPPSRKPSTSTWS